MKRLIAVFLSACLILSLFVGCQTEDSGEFPKGFSKEKAEKITKSLPQRYPHLGADVLGKDYPMPWYYTDGFGAYYLGRDNGYDIIYCYGVDEIFYVDPTEEKIRRDHTLKIGDSVFYPCVNPLLNVYKDGEILQLEEAYEQGLVSSEAVAAAAKTFDEYIQIILHSDPLEMAEAEYNYYIKAYPENPQIVKDVQWRYDNRMIIGSSVINEYKRFFDEIS